MFIGAVFILSIAFFVDNVLTKFFKTQANVESSYITAFILTFLIYPAESFVDITFIKIAFFSTLIAIASKYILTIKNKHIFNPAAIGVVFTAFVMNLSASWWFSIDLLAPIIIIGGFLIVRKIQRGDLVLSFLLTSLIAMFLFQDGPTSSFFDSILNLGFISYLVFFSTIMLTEPQTTPPNRIGRICYGIFVGILFTPYMHIGSIYMTPELTLVFGNIFSFIISPKINRVIRLKEIKKQTKNVYDFIFRKENNLTFEAGQYLEWTLSHKTPDMRGNRRYFTIASSPTEDHIILGTKFYQPSSSFKQALLHMKGGDAIRISGLAGDFVMPKDKNKKLVFIAGGIGVTPFRSMVKYLIDKNEKRDIVFLYSNSTKDDIAYKDVFDEAEKHLGIKVIYVLTKDLSSDSIANVYNGYINSEMLQKNIPDFKDRYFYISGNHEMIMKLNSILSELGIEKSHIKTDFFPGYV
jgi:ferredoxin-NADP reductase